VEIYWHPVYPFKTWYLLKQRDNFTLYLVEVEMGVYMLLIHHEAIKTH
jgi:hypothetical protein